MKEFDQNSIENLLKDLNINPDKEFVESSRKQMHMLVEQESINLNYLIKFMKNIFSRREFVFAAGLGLTILILAVLYSLSIQKLENTVTNPIALSENEQKEILKHVVENNNNKILSSDNSDAIYNSKFNYIHTISTTTYGNAIEKCKEADIYGNKLKTTNEYHQFENSKDVFFKTKEILDGFGVVSEEVDLHRETYDEQYIFKGGDYAVHKRNEFVASVGFYDPIDTKSIEEIVSQYNSEYIVTKIMIDGKEYYLLPQDTDGLCNGIEQRIISHIIVNKDTFEIEKYVDYLGSISDENIISQTVVTTELKTITLEDSLNIFKLEVTAPLKESSDSANDAQINSILKKETLNYFKYNKALIFVPESSQYKYKSIIYPYDLNNIETYTNDRKFYADNEIGAKFYEWSQVKQSDGSLPYDYYENFTVAMDPYAHSVMISRSNKNYTSESHRVYPTGLKEFMDPPSNHVDYKSHITINAKEIEVHVVRKISLGGKALSYIADFEYDGNKYVLGITDKSSDYDFTKLKFNVLDSSKSEDYKIIENIINEYYK